MSIVPAHALPSFLVQSHIFPHRRRQPPIVMSNEREESRRCPARRGMQNQGVREGKASVNTDQPTAGTAKERREVREIQGLDEEKIGDGLIRSRRRCLSRALHEDGRRSLSENADWIQLQLRDGRASINTDQPTARTAREGREVREIQGLDEEEIRDGLVRSRRRYLSCVLYEDGRQTPSENVERLRLRGWREYAEKFALEI